MATIRWSAALATAALCLPAMAATYTVDTTADSPALNAALGPQDANGRVSLRSAVMAANARPGADTILLSPGATYWLTLGPADSGPGAVVEASGDIDITDSLTIEGAGASVKPNGIDRGFDIEGTAGTPLTVTINDLSVVGGKAAGFLACGGGVNVRAAALTMNRCTVSESHADGNGGGIAVNGIIDPAVVRGALTLVDCIVNSNTGQNGGNVLVSTSDLILANTTLYSGTAVGDTGGGGVAILGDSTVANLTNVTLSGNCAPSGAGGGLVCYGGVTTSLSHATAAANTAVTGGGAARLGGTVQLRNTLIANNSGAYPELSGAFVSQGHNLVRDTTGAPDMARQTGDLFGNPTAGLIDALVGPLQDNGGPVFTRALLPGSPAIDAADPLTFALTDARGVRRPQDGNGDGTGLPDIGAFEVIPPYTTIDAARALRIAGGLVSSSAADEARLDVLMSDPGITVGDAALIVRKVAGLSANPM